MEPIMEINNKFISASVLIPTFFFQFIKYMAREIRKSESLGRFCSTRETFPLRNQYIPLYIVKGIAPLSSYSVAPVFIHLHLPSRIPPKRVKLFLEVVN